MKRTIIMLLPRPAMRFIYSLLDKLRGRELSPEKRVVSFLGNKRLTSVDVGACNGTFTFSLLRYSKRVIAFEPIPFHYNKIKKSFPSREVEVHQMGLSNSKRKEFLRIPNPDNRMLTGWSSIERNHPVFFNDSFAFEELEIQVNTLDNIIKEEIGLLKIDVEGHELSVIEGGRQLISKYKPDIVIESERRHNSSCPDKVIKLLCELGYNGFFIDGDRIRPISQFDPDTHQNSSLVHLDRVEIGYVYNFIFTTKKELPSII